MPEVKDPDKGNVDNIPVSIIHHLLHLHPGNDHRPPDQVRRVIIYLYLMQVVQILEPVVKILVLKSSSSSSSQFSSSGPHEVLTINISSRFKISD